MKAALLGLALLFVTACCERRFPQSVSPTKNPHYTVDLLFEHDGCRVYRFEDEGRDRYFVKCEDGTAREEHTEGCGKGCTNAVQVPTDTVRHRGDRR